MTVLRTSGIPDHVVDTPYLVAGMSVAATVVETRCIGLFDGPVGTGKTTAMDYVVADLQVPHAVIRMPPKPAPLTVLRKVVHALTGEPYDSNREQLEDIAVDLLTGWGGLLAVDEVQTIGTQGIVELRYLHDASRESFGLLLVGHGTEDALRGQAALDDRVAERARFRALVGDELIDVLHAIDPRLAATSVSVLARIDQRHCRGRLRDWAHVLRTLDRHHAEATHISGTTANELLTHLHRSPIQDPLDPSGPNT